MSMEADLVALLKTICTRTFPDVAPEGTAVPYITGRGLAANRFAMSKDRRLTDATLLCRSTSGARRGSKH